MARASIGADILRMQGIDFVRGPSQRRRGSDELEALRAAEDIVTGLIEEAKIGFVGNEKMRHVRDRLCDKIALVIAAPTPVKHCECCLFGGEP